MSANTTNYNLVKPSPEDEYDIGVYNGNLDVVDENLASQSNKIIKVEDKTMLHNDFVVGAKAGIDLSTGDVTLQVSDYCKGLLVISTSHETNALILPTTDYHKYSIYNADEQNTAIVKKIGGQCIEIASCTMVMVGFDGTDYRMLGGGASDATRFKPTAIDSAVGDLTVVGWDKDTGKWKAMQNGYALYYGGYLYGNGSRVPVTGLETDDGYKVYAQQDGSISTATTDYPLGIFCEGGRCVLLNFQGVIGNPKEYLENAVEFWAIFGPSTTIRLKIHLPNDSDGGELYRSSAQYTGEGRGNWGVKIADIPKTDDVNYYGDNKWFADTGLIDGNRYYYKIFPCKDGVYNETIGVNENHATAGGLRNEYTFSNDSGSTLIPNVGGDNGIINGAIHTIGPVGDCLVFDGVNDYISNLGISVSGDYTVLFMVKYLSGDTVSFRPVFSNDGDTSPMCGIYSNTLGFGYYANGFKTSSMSIAFNTWYRVACKRVGGESILVVNESVKSGTTYDKDLSITRLGRMYTNGGYRYAKFQLAQFRVMDRAITDDELIKLSNDGSYC